MEQSTLSFVATASAMLINVLGINLASNTQTLSQRTLPLENRYGESSVNAVFKDNILLTMAYMESKVENPKTISWETLEKPASFDLILNPNETFSFHEDVLAQYHKKVVKTTNAHFNYQEGFKSDGYLFGDGVCHLASLLYWVAKDANLEAYAPTNHDFAAIPDIPKEYGVSIYNAPGKYATNAQQNLYITNTKEKAVVFHFEHDKQRVKVSIQEVN